jgi:hypothetical protein
MGDDTDLKSLGGNSVPVQGRPVVPVSTCFMSVTIYNHELNRHRKIEEIVADRRALEAETEGLL